MYGELDEESMKKVGILTFTYGDNFGQRLQNLAVQEVIEEYGYRAYTIPQIIPKYYCIKNENRHSFFEKFDEKYINFYDKKIGKHKIPRGLNKFSYFVCGSDQIWSPFSPDVNSTFFLRFTPLKKRIAFSPSLAATEIPSKKLFLYKMYLNGFNKISVREEKSAEILQRITKKPITVLIDPTLMFDAEFWMKYEEAPKYNLPERYILYYGLGDTTDLEKVKDIARRRDCEVVVLKDGYEEFSIGPAEFLYLIKRAECVVTDSYHGTIFSILYRKSFLHLPRVKIGLDTSSRFDTLFSKLQIDSSRINNLENELIDNLDFDELMKILNEERKKVREFLSEYFV